MGSGLVVAVGVGIGIAVQVAVLGRSAPASNPLAVSFALQLAGVVIGGAWVTATASWCEVLEVSRRWWWAPLGAGGWIVVAALGFSSARIGVATTLGVSIAAQLLVGVLVDAELAMPRPPLLVGGVCIVVGATLISTST